MGNARNKLISPPEAIMINIPEAWFTNDGKSALAQATRRAALEIYYENMGGPKDPEGCFYHFISTIPRYEVLELYVCYLGAVRYKARVAGFIRNDFAPYPDSPRRNYVIATGPVIKPPVAMAMKGFRGFRYSQKIF